MVGKFVTIVATSEAARNEGLGVAEPYKSQSPLYFVRLCTMSSLPMPSDVGAENCQQYGLTFLASQGHVPQIQLNMTLAIALALIYLSQWLNFIRVGLSCLAFRKNLELFLPWWLESRAIYYGLARVQVPREGASGIQTHSRCPGNCHADLGMERLFP